MFCIVLADRSHGSCKRTFFKSGLRNTAFAFKVCDESAYFVCQWRNRPTPRPLTLDLLTPRHLITTTTTMVDYMFVFMPQKILDWIMNNRLAISVFFLLCWVSPSTVCLFTVCNLYVHAPSLLHFWWISWIRLDANILETMPRRTGGMVLVHVDMTWPYSGDWADWRNINLNCLFMLQVYIFTKSSSSSNEYIHLHFAERAARFFMFQNANVAFW